MLLRDNIKHHIDMWELVAHPALMERFVLRNGKAFDPLPADQWPDGAHEHNTPKQCFKNAVECAEAIGGQYVEGYAVRTGINELLIHHAWVEWEGAALDPTWDDTHECQYFGVTFDTAIVWREIVKNEWYGMLDNPATMINVELMAEIDCGMIDIVQTWNQKRQERAHG